MNPLQIEFPKSTDILDQNEEYFILKDGIDRKIMFHDYKFIFNTPGLYEEVFHENLKCNSPQVIRDLLFENITQNQEDIADLKILDFGAGNGLVAEALQKDNPEKIVGIDILEEAKNAALRDRPEVYEDYYVGNLENPSNQLMTELNAHKLNAFVSVAALGFDHIPPKSFINAFNLIEKNGWIAFNLRDKFLTEEDESGYGETLNWLKDEFIEFTDEKTYVHRLSVSGEEIYYTAKVGRKLKDIPLSK